MANGGRSLGVRAFERATGIRESDWLGKFWARWSDAVTEAGCTPSEWQERLESDFVFAKLAAAVRHYKRTPTKAELLLYQQLDPSFPSYKALIKHVGSTASTYHALREWAQTAEEYTDVLMLLPDIAAPESQSFKDAPEGFVYLIKSGDFYKIGRGDQIEKRVKQIRVALPDASALIHAIRTDDPPGIEAYWHRRFAEKRANGEWFKLASTDVSAFWRRKYQ